MAAAAGPVGLGVAADRVEAADRALVVGTVVLRVRWEAPRRAPEAAGAYPRVVRVEMGVGTVVPATALVTLPRLSARMGRVSRTTRPRRSQKARPFVARFPGTVLLLTRC